MDIEKIKENLNHSFSNEIEFRKLIKTKDKIIGVIDLYDIKINMPFDLNFVYQNNRVEYSFVFKDYRKDLSNTEINDFNDKNMIFSLYLEDKKLIGKRTEIVKNEDDLINYMNGLLEYIFIACEKDLTALLR